MRAFLSAILVLAASSWAMAQNEQVLFSSPGGFYDSCFQLTLECLYPQHHVRYTTNGSTPSFSSTRYTQPLLLDKACYSTSHIHSIPIAPDALMYDPGHVEHCIVIRAAVFDNNGTCLSPVATNSYFINGLDRDIYHLPAVSIAADSLALFDYDTGILVPGAFFDPNHQNWTGNYYESGIAWERLVNVEFYELDDNSGVNQLAGLRTHGGTGRRGPQKALKLYARKEYGTKRFRHPFFKELPIESYKHLVLKPFSCQWFQTGITDDICTRMAVDLDMETLASRPVTLFINGEYWGIYYLKEKPDAHYLEDHFGDDEEAYNVVNTWYGYQEDGDSTGFVTLMRWVANNDFADAENYRQLCTRIDVENLIDYYCLELFIANNDWPYNNMRCYQRHDSPWRWIFFDGDDCLMKMDFDVFGNATDTVNLGWPTDRQSTLMFRKLMENDAFQNKFFHRLDQLMNGTLNYTHTKTHYETAAALVRAEVEHQALRFGNPSSTEFWEQHITNIDHFLKNREQNMRERMDDFIALLLPDEQAVKVFPNPTSGNVTIRFHDVLSHIHQISIYDALGHLVYCQPVAHRSIEFSVDLNLNLAPGIYLLKIGNHMERLIIQ